MSGIVQKRRDSAVLVARPNLPLALSDLAVDLGSPLPIYAQICSAVRSAVEAGDLPPGTLMPTARDFAIALGVGRNTVVNAYSRLAAEGYLEAKVRRGTRVTSPASASAREQVGATRAADMPNRNESMTAPKAAYWARQLFAEHSINEPNYRPFSLHAVDSSLYPRSQLSRLLSEEFLRAPSAETAYGDCSDLQRFQTAVAAHVRQAHGIVCEPGQIIPTTDVAAAISLVARLIIDPGHAAYVEEPCWDVVRTIFSQSAGARIFPMPTGGSDANLSAMHGPPPRLICASPSVSFPFGIQMPDSRRQCLVDLARKSDSVIFEFDAYGELLFAGSRQGAIYSRDPTRVIYYAGLRKTFGPKLRVGYLIVPEHLVDPAAHLVRIAPVTPEHYVLSALATALNDGLYALHVKKLRAIYAERMAHLVDLCRTHIPLATVMEPRGGLHLTLLLPKSIAEAAVCEIADRNGLSLAPLGRFYAGASHVNGIVVGIGACPDRNLDSLVRRLAQCIDEAAENASGRPVGAQHQPLHKVG